MNEADTTYQLIEPALRDAGWGETEQSIIRKEYRIAPGQLLGQGRRRRSLLADYVLQYKNRNLAVVEAKSQEQPYNEGVPQAKEYAEHLKVRFAYATNGERIYEIDMESGEEREVDAFPSPETIWERSFPPPSSEEQQEIEKWREALFNIPFEDKSGAWQMRYYQENAIARVLDAVAERQQRILLTLATGTGKTAIAFQIAWKLFHSRWNLNRDGKRRPRILFLADRNILADQAFNSFDAFQDDALVRIRPEEIRKKGHTPKNGSIFFTIFQTFMSGEDEEPYFGEYPEDFFDFIIIDECHRGGANDESTWRAIMEHFSPAVQLGLTATPKRDVNVDTYAYFGEPVYTYSLKEGINDGFLTPFQVKEIATTIDTYQYTPDDDVIQGEVEEGKEYTEQDFNRNIEIREREEFRVKEFLRLMDQRKKTLVFCANQAHAAAVRDLINQHAESSDPNYCHRVTADDGERGEQHLRNFQDNERTIPTVLTTSQKLSTGVDAPEIRNIVLLRPINSMIEFKQIIGRGSRLFDGKDSFVIFDFVNAHKHFNDPEWDGPPLPPEEPAPKAEKGPCPECGERPCICRKEKEGKPCPDCGQSPCQCLKEGKEKMLRVKLAERKVIELDSMVRTSFWSPDGKPISAEEFVRNLFGDLPNLIQSEDELRRIWSKPDTRRKLMEELREKGYDGDQLENLRRIVHGEDSDLFDVLAYVAYHKEMVPRLQRAEKAKVQLQDYDPAQQDFLNFVLEQYVEEGVSELDDNKLKELLDLKYKGLYEAKKELGGIERIREAFIGVQELLYRRVG